MPTFPSSRSSVLSSDDIKQEDIGGVHDTLLGSKDDMKMNRNMDILQPDLSSSNVYAGGMTESQGGRVIDNTTDMSSGQNWNNLSAFEDNLRPDIELNNQHSMGGEAGAMPSIPNRPIEGMVDDDKLKDLPTSDHRDVGDVDSIPAPIKAKITDAEPQQYDLDDSLQHAHPQILQENSSKSKGRRRRKSKSSTVSAHPIIDQDAMLGLKNKALHGVHNPNLDGGLVIPPRDHVKDHVLNYDSEQDRQRNARFVHSLEQGRSLEGAGLKSSLIDQSSLTPLVDHSSELRDVQAALTARVDKEKVRKEKSSAACCAGVAGFNQFEQQEERWLKKQAAHDHKGVHINSP